MDTLCISLHTILCTNLPTCPTLRLQVIMKWASITLLNTPKPRLNCKGAQFGIFVIRSNLLMNLVAKVKPSRDFLKGNAMACKLKKKKKLKSIDTLFF